MTELFNKKYFFKKKHLAGYILSIFLLACLTLTYLSGVFENLSLICYDLHFYMRGPVAPDHRIVIVSQDDESLESFNIRISDWPRSTHAKLIDQLYNAGAELIVFDYDFSKPTTPEEDLSFAEAIIKAGNVILANRYISSGEVIHPLPLFADESLGEGLINVQPDKDTYWRRTFYMIIGNDGYVYFSLPLKVVEIYEDFPEEQMVLDRSDYLGLGPYQLPYPDMHINFSGPEKTIPYLTYHKIINGNFSPEDVEGKIVLVGNTTRLGKDYFSTPTSPDMPGVEVHANAISTILNRSFIIPLSQDWMLVLIICLGVLEGLIFFHPRTKVKYNLIIAGMLFVFLILASWLLFINQRVFLDIVPLILVLFVNIASGSLFQLAVTRKRERMVKKVFGQYISRNVADTILSEDVPIEMHGHKTELTVLFSDIRGFTSISERFSPVEVSKFLNKYFEEMIQVVFDYNGTLDKLMGDAVMAFFGAPLHFPDHPARACRCALQMMVALKQMKKNRVVKDIDIINIGIGLNTGEVIAGNLGSRQYIDYTVIGDTVNLGSRLEGLNKQYGTEIIISEFTYACVMDEFECREIDLVAVKGKSEPIRIYELMGEKKDFGKDSLAFLKDYLEGLSLYKNRNWKKAIKCFQRVVVVKLGDGPSILLINRCEEFLITPPPDNWSGVCEMKTK
jgi:adenylate cyclase